MHVAIQTNVVTVTPKPEVFVDLAGIAGSIKGAGFAPGKMTLSAVGQYERKDNVTVFRIRSWPEAYPIDAPPKPTTGELEVRASVDYASDPPRLNRLGD